MLNSCAINARVVFFSLRCCLVTSKAPSFYSSASSPLASLSPSVLYNTSNPPHTPKLPCQLLLASRKYKPWMCFTSIPVKNHRVPTLSELQRRQIAHLYLPHVRLRSVCPKTRLSAFAHRFKCLRDHAFGSPRPRRYM